MTALIQRRNRAEISDAEFEAMGYTGEARNYPMTDIAWKLFAAFQGNVAAERLPRTYRFHPNQWSQAAWERVAEAARMEFAR